MQLRFHNKVSIPVKKNMLEGEFSMPEKATSIILLSLGDGSNFLNNRNQVLVHYLHQNNIGTLAFDLLTSAEDLHSYNRFDIDLLANRLIAATEWLEMEPASADCRLGYFCTGTGTAAALKAASFLPQVGAIVSRSGRPDLAIDIMEDLETPTLLIAGSQDAEILGFNQTAYTCLIGDKKLEILEGADQFFEEPGNTERVCELAANWFKQYLRPVILEEEEE